MLKIIISPAKKMTITDDYPRELTDPVFLDRALELHALLKDMDPSGLKNLWKCSDRLAEQNYKRIHTYSPDQALTPALLSYEGLQYQHIAPGVFTDSQWDYAISHVRILSGFYGVLSPMDRVIPYRLEMQAKLKTDKGSDLYEYWGDSLYRELLREGTTELINLASGEYSRAVLPWLSKDAPAEQSSSAQPPAALRRLFCITCIFGEVRNGEVKMKGTQAKIARGEMVRWMAENRIEHSEEIREFRELGYEFQEKLSTAEEFVFVRSEKS